MYVIHGSWCGLVRSSGHLSTEHKALVDICWVWGLCCLCIKPCTSYLWCGATFRNSSLSIKPCSSYLSQCARLRLEVRIIAVYKTAYLPFASCEAWVRAGVFKPWSTGCMRPSYHFCAAAKEGKTEITQFTVCYTTSNHLIITFRCGNFSFEEVTWQSPKLVRVQGIGTVT